MRVANAFGVSANNRSNSTWARHLSFFCFSRDAGAELLQPLRRQATVFRRECFEHVQVVEVAERLAKVVQGFGLRVQRIRPSRRQERELIA